MALSEEKASECPCCGIPSELAHSAEHEFEWDVSARECYAGRARAEVQEENEENKIYHYPAAVLYQIKRNPNLWPGVTHA